MGVGNPDKPHSASPLIRGMEASIQPALLSGAWRPPFSQPSYQGRGGLHSAALVTTLPAFLGPYKIPRLWYFYEIILTNALYKHFILNTKLISKHHPLFTKPFSPWLNLRNILLLPTIGTNRYFHCFTHPTLCQSIHPEQHYHSSSSRISYISLKFVEIITGLGQVRETIVLLQLSKDLKYQHEI